MRHCMCGCAIVPVAPLATACRIGDIRQLDTTVGGSEEDCYDIDICEEQMLAEEKQYAWQLDNFALQGGQVTETAH